MKLIVSQLVKQRTPAQQTETETMMTLQDRAGDAYHITTSVVVILPNSSAAQTSQ